MAELRQYQSEAIRQIHAHWDAGRRRVLWAAPTGAGKGVVLSHILETAAAAGKRAGFVVRGRELVKQGSARLSCDHGVLMANHPSYAPEKPIQVCSIDTMKARGLWPAFDILVIDEVHWATTDSYLAMASHYAQSFMLGVTATPFPDKSLRHVAEVIVETCTIETLITDGFLVPPRYFAPSKPDLSGVSVHDGDYSRPEVEALMANRKVVGNVVETYVASGEGRPALCFASGVEHSLRLCEAFNWAGIAAEHLDADAPDEVRRQVLERSRSGATRVVSNCNILATGVDMPWLSCLIVARPTLSPILNRQMIGRGTRIFPGKHNFLVLDHAGNVHYHGFITQDIPPTLDGRQLARMKGQAAIRTCGECFAVFPVSLAVCPECGAAMPEGVPAGCVMSADGRLVELRPEDMLEPLEQARILKRKLVSVGLRRGWKRGFVFHLIKKQFGEHLANAVLPYNGTSSLSRADFG